MPMSLEQSFPSTPSGCAAWAFAVSTVFFAVRQHLQGRRLREARLESQRLRSELEKAGGAARSWEYRLERFDVLWFASVTALPASREVARVVAGLPHCPSCVVPLAKSAKGEGWSCPRCEFATTAALEDVALMDVIEKQALRHFKERHPDFRTAAEKQVQK